MHSRAALFSALAAAASGALALLPRAALADCAAGIAALQPQVEQVSQGRQRELLDFDLKRARKELGEGECQEALDHAGKLLHGED